MTPEQIGEEYVRAAQILRDTREFGRKPSASRSALRHTFDESRTQLHPRAVHFASQIVQLAQQVDGELSDDAFRSKYLVNLGAFSRITTPSTDPQELRKIAFAYVPITLDKYLSEACPDAPSRVFDFYKPRLQQIHGTSESVQRSSDPDAIERGNLQMVKLEDRDLLPDAIPRVWPMSCGTEGYCIQIRGGIFTASLVIIASCVPTIVYLVLRVHETDPETVIQTLLSILASTLFILSSPFHRTIFNNWRISEALFGLMTLDGDTWRNITSQRKRREVGIGLITQGDMKLLSNSAGYAAPYSGHLDPGPMMLSILTFHPLHRILVDQDGEIVLAYGDGNAVKLWVPLGNGGRYLSAQRYTNMRWWYMLEVPRQAGTLLVI